MRVFRVKYKNNDGTARETMAFVIEFMDSQGICRRIGSGLRDKKQALALGRQIVRLAALQSTGEPPDPALSRWIEAIPPRLKIALGRVGLLDAKRMATLEPLLHHLEGVTDARGRVIFPGYKQALLARGLNPRHISQMVGYAKRIIEACHFRSLSDLKASAVQQFVSGLRADQVDETGKAKKRGASLQTCNRYIRAAKALSRWLWRDGRTQEDALAHLSGFNVALDRRHDRRALSDEELVRVIAVAESGPTILGLSGQDRGVIYRVAAGTGFRAGELGSLLPESFDLDADPPVIVVEAGYSKRRRRDVQPIRRDLADFLRSWLRDKRPGEPVFKMPHKPVNLIRADLAAARAAWLEEARSDQERLERERTTFLAYRDGGNRVADFHALRHTYVSRLVASGANIKVAQELARHSTPTLTLGIYAHATLLDQTRALDALPAIETGSQKHPAANTIDRGAA